jgi:hypothetical protein
VPAIDPAISAVLLINSRRKMALIALVSIWRQAAATRRPTVIAMGCTWRKLRF